MLPGHVGIHILALVEYGVTNFAGKSMLRCLMSLQFGIEFEDCCALCAWSVSAGLMISKVIDVLAYLRAELTWVVVSILVIAQRDQRSKELIT